MQWHNSKNIATNSHLKLFSKNRQNADTLVNKSFVLSKAQIKIEKEADFMMYDLILDFPNHVKNGGVASLDGDTIDYKDESFNNKVRIIQITGSWCPNCKDEGLMFVDFYRKYQNRGLEIIAVSFERSAEFAKVLPAILKYQGHLNIPYPMTFGGKAQKEVVMTTFPALSDFYAYPTAIYIDRNGKVRKIHTGFRGPGTSDYKAFASETEAFVENLLEEI